MGGSIGILVGSCGYGLLLLGWFVLYRCFGDTRWPLALAAPFAPLFFLPLLVQIGAAFWLPSPIAWASWAATVPPLAIFLWLYADYFFKPLYVPTDASPSFSLMTFNIWWQSQQRATARVPLLASTQLENGPDIVALQELLPQMARHVAEETAHEYPYRLFDVAETTAAQRLGIMSRYPLEPVDATHLQAKDFRVQMARVHTPGHPVLLYNIHPRATLIVRYVREGRPLGPKVAKSFAQRYVYFEGLLADIRNRREPVLVAGDYNSTDLSDVYALMRCHLIDVHRAAGRGWGHTFPMHGADFGGLPVPRRLMRLDMIFCSPELTPLACRVATVHGESDHLPVIAQLGWDKAPAARVSLGQFVV